MNRTFKKVISMLLVVVLLFGSAPLSGFVGLDLPSLFDFKAKAATYSGTCGDNLTWNLNTNTGVLTISGIGEMWNFSQAPWDSYENYIKSVDIGDKVTTLGDYAFCGCNNLTAVIVPDSILSLGKGVFAVCTKLFQITLSNKIKTIPENTFFNCTSLSRITIPNNVTSIGSGAFESCDSLTSITIPDNIKTIGDNAFQYCNNLVSVTIKNGVTSIGDFAFYGCKSLECIIVPDSVITIGSAAFSDCESLSSVSLGKSVITIGDSAFSSCSSLKSITIPNGITAIGNSVFSYCSNLSNVKIPNSVRSIGDNAFYICSGLTNITIPDSVTTIGSAAFNGCDSLISIIIPDSVTTIGISAFSSCDNLLNVTIGNSVSTIGVHAFSYCTTLTEVVISDSVETIGNCAFLYCTNLKEITIPKSINIIGDFAFNECLNLNFITVDMDNKNYSNDNNGVLFDKDKKEIIQYPLGNTCKEYTIPSSVILICGGAFKYSSHLTNVVMPDSVTAIGYQAFYDCNELVNLKLSNNLTSIGAYAFSDCKKLTDVVIPSSVTTIESCAFGYCKELTTVVIPQSVTTIEIYAFDECENLTDVYYGGTEQQWNGISIDSYNGSLLNATIHYNSNNDLPENQKSIAVFSTEKSFTVEPGESMWLAFGLIEKDVILGEWMPMAITVSDPTVISLSEYEKTDYGYSLEVTGEKEGFTNLTITDTETGLTTDIVVTVRDSYSQTTSFPIEGMNTFYPDNKWENHVETNFYNINGLYMNNYRCTKSGEKYYVNFDIYNQKYHIGAVDVYDADGNWMGSKRIDKCTEMSSLYEWGEQLFSLAFIDGRFAYNHPLNSKKTSISIEVPKDGHFVISNNFAESPGCFYYNSIDLFIQGAVAFLELAAGNVDNTVNEFTDVLNNEIKKNKVLGEVLHEAFANIGGDKLTAISQNILDGNVEDSCSDIVDLLENILNSTIAEFDWKKCLNSVAGIGESLFEEFAGPAGKALKVCFSISKSVNILGQARNIAYSMDTPYVNVYSKIPEGFVAPNGTIVNTNGNIDTEAVLQVFRIYNNDSVDSLVGNDSSKDYNLYNICFVKNDKLVQPNGKVKVYMPIPEDMKGNTCKIYRQEADGLWTDIRAKVENNYLVFETDHFSLYAIIGVKAEISISSLPHKLHYSIGDTLDITGLSLEINGEPVTNGFFCNPTVLYTVGTQKITVNYNGLTSEFEITVTANSPKINTPSVTTVNYGDTLVLTIEDIILPAGCAIEWLVDGNGFSSTVSEDDTECRLTSIASDAATITVHIVDENGEAVLDSDGNEIFDEINLKSKAGFFQKLISFFKNLFRISRIILQSI